MIFSLLKVRKKTGAAIAGIAIAILCLWGISMWQNISLSEMMQTMLSTILLLLVIILSALFLITILKLVVKNLRKLVSSQSDEEN